MDVLVENFRPGVMEGWGLGPAHLKPDLIYTRISGYGQVKGGGQEGMEEDVISCILAIAINAALRLPPMLKP